MDIQKWLRTDQSRSMLSEDEVIDLIERDAKHLFWQNDTLKVQILIKALFSNMIDVSDKVMQYLDLTDELNQRIALIFCGPDTPDISFPIQTFVNRYHGRISSDDLEIAVYYDKIDIVTVLTSESINVPITKAVYDVALNHPRIKNVLDQRLRYQLKAIRDIGFEIDPNLSGRELAEKLNILREKIREAKKLIERS